MSKGDGVQLTGFGSFVVRDRAARTGRNPQTGATIQIAASKVAAFIALEIASVVAFSARAASALERFAADAIASINSDLFMFISSRVFIKSLVFITGL
jgi:hypothetical protein